MTQPNTSLAQDTILMGEQDYARAIQIVLRQAEQQLCIFDQDLSRGEFASLETYNILQQFLSQHARSELTIILQDTRFFEQNCPRLHHLLQTYSHKMTVYETNQTVKHAKDCFVLADAQHYIKRIHIDQARFKYALNDALNTEQLNNRFDELREATHYPLAVTQLGL